MSFQNFIEKQSMNLWAQGRLYRQMNSKGFINDEIIHIQLYSEDQVSGHSFAYLSLLMRGSKILLRYLTDT